MWSPTLSVVSCDIAADAEDDFNAWYSDIHVPELVHGIPGFLSGRRYRSIQGEPRYLAIYELESAAAYETPELRRLRGWGAFEPRLRNFHGRLYEQIGETVSRAPREPTRGA